MNIEQSDVTFTLEGIEVPAHKMVLCAQSYHFHKFFSERQSESNNRIALDVTLESFRILLKYIYTGRVSLIGLEVNQVIDVLDAAEQCECEPLKIAVAAYLKSELTIGNCCTILNAACLNSMNPLREACLIFMDKNSSVLIKHGTFKTLSNTSLSTLLERDTFYAPEIDIFHAVQNWWSNNPTGDPKASSGQGKRQFIHCL